MTDTNKIKLEIAAKPENTSMARVVASAFAAALDATVDEVTEIKTAVSEAVTNAIIHGYASCGGANTVTLIFSSRNREITVEVIDSGIGIENISSAREPLFTTKPEMERSGLGFTVMESFMDTVEISSQPQKGTTIKLTKKLGDRQ